MIVVWIVIPFPLRPECCAIEVVRRLWPLARGYARIAGNRAGRSGLTGRLTVRIGADHRPIIVPAHRLKVNDAPVRAVGLEMNKPSFTFRRFHIPPLMRTVDIGRTLGEHYTMLVRTVNLPRA